MVGAMSFELKVLSRLGRLRGLLVAVVAMFALGAAGGEAAAKGSKGGKSSKKKGRKWGKRPNMPPGWVWPPSDAMIAEGDRCKAHLTELGVKWEVGQAERKIATPIVVPDMKFGGIELVPLWRKPPFVMDCHMAEAWAEKGGPALAAIGVEKVVFSTIYKYRNVDGMNVLSRHALGLAMDVYQFITTDGKTHVVLGDYRRGDTVLHDIENTSNATGGYRMLLTPGNDRGHYDHFHFEARTPGERIETPPTRQPKPKKNT